MEVFVTWKTEKGPASSMTASKRGGMEGRLMEFVPLYKTSEEHFRSVFESIGLTDIVQLHKAQANQEAKRDLHQLLLDDLADNRPIKDIVLDLKEITLRCGIPEHEGIGLIWSIVMGQAEWNKKPSLKGKMLFLDPMKKFIAWLQNAEEKCE